MNLMISVCFSEINRRTELKVNMDEELSKSIINNKLICTHSPAEFHLILSLHSRIKLQIKYDGGNNSKFLQHSNSLPNNSWLRRHVTKK